MKYEVGKVYLRDIRSGQIYLYERNLENNANFEACVPNPVKEPVKESEKEPTKQDTGKPESDAEKVVE